MSRELELLYKAFLNNQKDKPKVLNNFLVYTEDKERGVYHTTFKLDGDDSHLYHLQVALKEFKWSYNTLYQSTEGSEFFLAETISTNYLFLDEVFKQVIDILEKNPKIRLKALGTKRTYRAKGVRK